MNRYTHRRMTGGMLGEPMRELGLTVGEVMRFTGASRLTVTGWLEEREPIPHWMNVLITIFQAAPDTITLVRNVTNQYINEKPAR